MSEEKENNIYKRVKKNYWKHFFEKTSLASFLALGVIICLIPAYFIPSTLIITIPLLGLPLLTGLIFLNDAVGLLQTKPIKIFNGFKIYYSQSFFGCYKVIQAIFKAIAVYLISATILMIILHFSVGMKDPSYSELITSLVRTKNVSDLERGLLELQDNSVYQMIENITSIVSIGLAVYMFAHHVLTHAFKIAFNATTTKPNPAPVMNAVHAIAFKKFRKDFYMDYYSSFWPLILMYLVSYGGGATLALLFLNQSGMHASIIGLVCASIICCAYLPFLFDVYKLIYTVDSLYYLTALLELSKNPLFAPLIVTPKAELDNLEKVANELDSALKEVKEDIKKEKAAKKAKKKNKDKPENK